jgi:hypothetical protein
LILALLSQAIQKQILLGGFVLGLVARCSGLAPLRDKAFFGYYYALAAYDAPIAAAWANGIRQLGPRDEAMKAVYKQWSLYDEPAARNLDMEVGVPSET